VAPTNDDCLACHGDESARRANGTSIAVAADPFGKSVHGQFACVDCHADLAKTTEWPHPEKLQRVSCATCHDESVKGVQASVHYANGKGARCVDCHGMHDILPASNPASRTYALNLPKTCAQCHSQQHLEGLAGRVADSYVDSVHGRGVARAGLVVSANCTSCHGAHDIKPKTDPASHVYRTNIVGTCTTCHEGIAPVYAKSVHAQAQRYGNQAAAVCSDCHTSHTIQRAETDQWKLAAIDECGNCHLDKIGTYRDTFHGQVTALGFTRTASCSDCHGHHDILPASSAASVIAPGNLVTTCGKCHENANANFVKYDPHADKHDRFKSPELYWASIFMQLLLWGVFITFGVHTLVWFPRSFLARRAARAKGERA
jgi:nitrate/TMAO reductase-like tetraheme cytochrome c subunit